MKILESTIKNSKNHTFRVCPGTTIKIINSLIKKSKVYK